MDVVGFVVGALETVGIKLEVTLLIELSVVLNVAILVIDVALGLDKAVVLLAGGLGLNDCCAKVVALGMVGIELEVTLVIKLTSVAVLGVVLNVAILGVDVDKVVVVLANGLIVKDG